jgi:hypothetical protein
MRKVLDDDGNLMEEWLDDDRKIVYTKHSHKPPGSVLKPSRDGFEVPKNGTTLVDNKLCKWTLVGTNIHVDGQPYRFGVAKTLLFWKGQVVHQSPTLNPGWITDTPSGWSQPGPDPRGTAVVTPPPVTPPPVQPPPVQPPPVQPPPVTPPPTGFTGQTRGSIAGNVITVTDSTGFKIGDWVIIPANQERGQDGPGGGWPSRRGSQSQLNSLPEGSYIADGAFVFQKDNGIIRREDRAYYDGMIVPRAYQGVIQSINGNKWTMDRPCVNPASDVDVFFDGAPKALKAIQDAPDGKAGALTKVNLNALFPGFKRVAFGGAVVPMNKKYVEVTSDARDSIEVFAPKGAPAMAFQFRNSVGCRTRNFTVHGNFGDHGFGFGWEGSTKVQTRHGFLGDTFVSVGQMYMSGLEFWDCDDCESHDQTVIDVGIGAWRCESSRNCWGRRIYNRQNAPHKNYVQWQFHVASSTNCGTEDCVFDSEHLTPAFENMHSSGGGHIRPKMRNGMMAMNNAGGWRIESPRLKFDAGCMNGFENDHGYWQFAVGHGYGTPAININQNAGNWKVGEGGTMTDVVVDQSAGYLDSKGNNLVGLSVQDQIVNFKLDGLNAPFPAQRKTGGACGIQCYGPGASVRNVKVTGECINERNIWNAMIVDASNVDVGSIDVPAGGRMIGWQVRGSQKPDIPGGYEGPFSPY